MAEDLARHGWAVALHYNRSRSEAEDVVKACRRLGADAVALEADLADAGALPDLVQRASAALGPLTLLINNASVFEDDSFETLEPQAFSRQFQIDCAAPIFLSQAFVRQLPSSIQGNIIHLIDQRVLKPTPHFFSYQLAKSALWTATVTMAQALAPRVRVNAIGPGPTLAGPRQRPEDFARQASLVPLGAGPALDEFGRAVRFLVESRSITGQMITLDGGQHIAWQTPDVTEAEE
jgi:NAD(P)-dependent dehydrogenase (short-subunit alcohol dehydrogenase family)